MPLKYKLQLLHDLLLTALFLSVMGYHIYLELIHEWAGIVFFALVFLHSGLNLWWFKKLTQGQYDAYRLLQTGVNLLTFILFMIACVSGVMMSNFALPDLPISMVNSTVRKLHMLSSHWLQLLIGVHLGLHWKMLANFLAKLWQIDLNGFNARRRLPALWLVISAYGIYALIKRDIHHYLFGLIEFAALDFDEPKWLFYLDFFAIVIFAAYLTRFLVWLCLFRRKD
ncbi:DUF4405 domain-containing protein [Pasteurella testudinis]|uniref:DUF4405 domain-containing protein n=1 Tax=Pasteurella testudinis TaxID=761 RepID=UPI00405951BC